MFGTNDEIDLILFQYLIPITPAGVNLIIQERNINIKNIKSPDSIDRRYRTSPDRDTIDH